jgi:predicted nucleic acid-binding protein
MSGFLLDTNVISEFARPDNKPDPRVQQWLEAANPDSLYASVLTFGEIRRGIEKLSPGKRRTHLETWLGERLTRMVRQTAFEHVSDVRIERSSLRLNTSA